MSKYLIKDKRAFVSFPGLSSSVLLIGLKVNPLFVWSVMGEGGELFSLIIVPLKNILNLMDFALVKGIVDMVFHMYTFPERS